MRINKSYCFFFAVFAFCFSIFLSCHNSKKPAQKVMIPSVEDLQMKTQDLIAELLSYAEDNDGKLDDSIEMLQLKAVNQIYKQQNNLAFWSKEKHWQPLGDSLLDFIKNSKLFGLFPDDYHYQQLSFIQTKFINDLSGKNDRSDAVLWSKADVLLTDAFIQIIKDIKLGRLPEDSISMRPDSVLRSKFCQQQFYSLKQSGSLSKVISSLEPDVPGYQLLKAGIKKFLDNAGFKEHSFVPPPLKDVSKFRKALQERLFEEKFIATDTITADSLQLSQALKRFQQRENIEADGKIGAETLRLLNMSDSEKFARIAITMDRYKMLPKKMPEKYVWVNLAAFQLQLWEGDSIKIISKIVCGKPSTRSPVLTSAIGELITYPKWTIPASIVEKEVLPGIKKNKNYLSKKGYSLFDKKGNEVNPDSVDWSKYNKTIPYHVIQGSGDANALGVLKFNFNNKYAVYLHDTNERYLFAKTDRAASHGCIRVQEWKQLAYYIIKNDSINGGYSPRMDSLQKWLRIKEKHSIPIRNKLPLFIRYYTCEGKKDGIIFYDDIYGEDKKLAEKYFSSK